VQTQRVRAYGSAIRDCPWYSSDGNILLAGQGADSSYYTTIAVVEFNGDGTLDTSFGSGGIVTTEVGNPARALAMSVLPSGAILVGGVGTDTAGHTEMALVEYNGDGSLDTAFGSGGIVTYEVGANSQIDTLSVQSDGTILVGGTGTDTGGHTEMALLKFNSSGSLDTSFGSGGVAVHEIGTASGIDAITVNSDDGTILAAGYGLNGSGQREVAVLKFEGDGSLDTVFGSGGVVTTELGSYSMAKAMIVDSAGTILVAGKGTGAYSGKQVAIIAYNGDGSLDTSFGNGGAIMLTTDGSTGNAEALQSDGKLVVGGKEGTDFAVFRFNATSSVSLPLTYDNNGNTLTDENGMTYTYDAWNRMVTATPPDSAVYGNTYHEDYYSYNALGERVTSFDGIESGVGPVLVINDGNAQRSMIDSLTVVFPEPVTLSSGAFELSESGVGDLTISWSNPSGDGETWVISLAAVSGLSYDSLPNGQYTLTIHHADVSGYTMSADQTYNFHRLFGDFYGTGSVNAADWALLSSVFNISSKYLWYVDQNDDGTINFSDELAAAQDGPYSYTDTAAGPIWIGTSTTEGVASGHTLVSLSPRDFYYSSQWQVIQETANNSGTGAMQTADQYVWGIAYVNELVLRDADSDGSSSTGSYGNAGSGLDQRLYALQDANYNVTALVGLVSGSWTVVERFEYTPYGTMTVLNASGAQTTDSFNWLYGFQGGRRDAVTGLISFQNRNYDPTTGTWMTQDPDGYVNGASLYQFVASNPIDNSDPSGLAAEANPQPVPEPPQGPNGPGGPIGLPPGHSWAPNPPPKPGRRQGYHPVPPVRGLPSGSQPGISWNGTPPGSWGLDDGKKGPRQHFDPDGNPLAPDEAHPFIPPIDIPHIDPITERKLIHNTCAAGLSGTIIIIIIIIGAPVGA
jgi:RHS repeat-associated protein/uncharacterized delta-60 repeat protein